MSDTIQTASLAGLAAKKGAVSRDDPDSRAKAASVRYSASERFDGFLKTFLGQDRPSRSGKQGRSGGGSGRDKASPTPASKMSPEEKRALRQAVDKTVSSREEPMYPVDMEEYLGPLYPAEEEFFEDDVAAAAEEAARMLWELLYGPAAGPAGDAGAVSALAGLLGADGSAGGLAGMAAGGAGIDAESMTAALETANASAEMNSAAVIAALEELLDGMPREALEQALERLARESGMEEAAGGGSILDRMAESLGLEVLEDTAGTGTPPRELLAELAKAAAMADPAAAADNSPEAGAFSPLSGLFSQFLQEKAGAAGGEGPISLTDQAGADSLDDLLDAFAEWIFENSDSPEMRALAADRNKLASALYSVLNGSGASGQKDGAVTDWVLGSLESMLQSGAEMKGPKAETAGLQTAVPAPDTAGGFAAETGNEGFREPGGDGSAQNAFAPAAAAGTAAGTAAAPISSQSSFSSMLDQIQNIERIAEAMRAASRGGIKQLTVQLTPDELGKILLRVESRGGGVVSAYIRVENPEAAAHLSANLAQLRENLKAQGIELGDFDIRQQPQGHAADDFGGQHRKDRDRGGDEKNSIDGARPPDEPDPPPDDTVLAGPGHRDAQGNLNFFA